MPEASAEARSTRDSRNGTSPTSGTDRFRLEGPSRRLDLRIHAARPDIADVEIAHLVFAPHYARAQIRAVAAATPMLTAPNALAEPCSQLLAGEEFALLDVQGGWGWGYSRHDHYVGYVAADQLTDPFPPTHVVSVREALVFAEADIKSAIIGTLSLGARIAGQDEGSFVKTAAGHVHQRHLVAANQTLPDHVATAEMLLGAPYRWGGRGAGGIDCSGLVQLALGLSGIDCPRDTDQQRETIGDALGDTDPLQRGDLVYFPGHVGIMADDCSLLHANAYWMGVTLEPLADVVARLAPLHDRPVLARRRLPK